jgi:hypothetical protein
MFVVDAFSCNGMMIGMVTSKWQGMYPGNGNAGVSGTAKSCAYYSHSTSVFKTGDVICLVAGILYKKLKMQDINITTT